MDTSSLLSLTWIYNLFRIGQESAASQSDAQAVQELLTHIVSGFHASSGSLAFAVDAQQLRIVAGINIPSAAIGGSIPIGDGVLGWVAERRQALLLNGDIAGDPRFRNLKKRSNSSIPVVALCMPLLLGRDLIGVMSLNRQQGEAPFTDEDLANGSMAGNLIALVVENLRLHGDARRRITELSNMSAILEATTDLVCTADSEGRLTYMNNAGRRMLDLPVEQLLDGLPITDFLSHWSVAQFQHEARPYALRDGTWQGESEIRSRQGREIPVSHLILVHQPASGATPFLSLSMRDISERKQNEEEMAAHLHELQQAYEKLEQAQAQLLQSEKMASIGQLAAGVAHEINNPVGYVNSNLGTLLGYVNDLFGLLAAYERAEPLLAGDPALQGEIEALKQRLDLGFLREDTLSLVKESQEGITRVKKIVQDLKEFSHVDRAEWQQADLHLGIDSTLNIVNNEIKYKAEVVKGYGQLPPVECIPAQINQVIMNLLVNAAQAIDTRGTITIRTGTEGELAYVEIADTGKGIAPETLKRIFEPFYTTKAVGKGTGLGLSLSYNIVKKHNGRIDVYSTPGQGTTFRVWVPIRHQDDDHSNEKQRAVGT